jgi:hypothetical protein
MTSGQGENRHSNGSSGDTGTTAEKTTPAERAADVATGNRVYKFLENNLFKDIIGYTIHPFHILALLVLWIGLLLWHNTMFELVGGNYTNGLSAMAASIVLLQQTRQHREVKRLHRQHAALLEEIRNKI